MLIYLICFFISLLFLWLAEHSRVPTSKCLTCIALLFPIVLAGLRKAGVGTDTLVYVTYLYDRAHLASNFFDYLNSYSPYVHKTISQWEPLYNVMFYFSVKLTDSFQGPLFATHFLIIFFFYKGLKHQREHLSITLGMFIFYFTLFPLSLNMMRQCIAMAILFYAVHFLQKKKIIWFYIFLLFAVGFHSSAFLGVSFHILYLFLQKESKLNFKVGFIQIDPDFKKIFYLMIFVLIALFSLDIVIKILGLFGAKFAYYAKAYLAAETFSFLPKEMLRRAFPIFLLYFNWKRIKKVSSITPFVCAMVCIEVLLGNLSSVSTFGARIGYYMSMFQIILVPQIIQAQTRHNKFFYIIATISFYFLNYYYFTVVKGYNQTIPYLFFWE